MCSSHVLMPHNAFMNDPAAGLGLHQLGAGTASAKLASERPLRPKHLPFPPPACSPYELTPHNASLNDPDAGLELHQLGEGPSSGLHGNSKSDAVLDSCPIICVLFMIVA